MADVTTAPVLAAQSSISKANLEAIFAEIVKVIGGTYYVTGSSTTQNPGTITTGNFRRDAAIPNRLKNEPYSIVPIQLQLENVPDATAVVAFAQLPFVMEPAEWVISWSRGDGNTANWNYTVVIAHNGVTVSTVVGGGPLGPEAPGAVAIPSGILTMPAVRPGDSLTATVTITKTGGTTTFLRNVCVTVWCKAKHVA